MASQSHPALANGLSDGSKAPGTSGRRVPTDSGSDYASTRTGQQARSQSQGTVLRIPAKNATAHVNVIIAGGAGLGKSTFIKQFFHDFVSEDFVPHDGTPTAVKEFSREGGAASLCTHLPEPILTSNSEYKLYWHFQDTPGRTNLNNSAVKDLVIKHLQSEQEAHFRMRMDHGTAEGNAATDGRSDRLIDLALYFIAPQSFGQMDVDFIAELSKEVVVIPVCAKADTMTVEERAAFHHQVKERLTAEGITYGFIDEEIAAAASNVGITSHKEPLNGPPFLMVSSNSYKQIGSELQPVRSYPWGDCIATDPRHSDYALIKEFITTTAFHKLRSAKKRHFHRYCRTRMSQPWHEVQDGHPSTKPEAPGQKDTSKEDMLKLSQELSTIKAELESERLRADEAMDKMSSASSVQPITPQSYSYPAVGTPEKVSRTKSGLFSRNKPSPCLGVCAGSE
ncbi:hypothetical protein WJX73_008550 [Symbiochloris irregularis]|uniref:Septin-type G domain-containing protein n=1 Tax=Symbiochloris irregularis TaxID=706552 RepID=A0AAW1NSM5_9CHLO